MLIQPLVRNCKELRLRGMAAALEQQLATPDRSQLSFRNVGLMTSTSSPSAARHRLASACAVGEALGRRARQDRELWLAPG